MVAGAIAEGRMRQEQVCAVYVWDESPVAPGGARLFSAPVPDSLLYELDDLQKLANHRLEGIGAPFVERPGGNYVGVAGEAEYRGTAAALRPEIIDRAEAQAFDGKPGRGKPLDHQCLAPTIGGADRLTRNQLLRQR